MKILFTGGGTAGHIFPIIAIIRELKKQGFVFTPVYMGPKDEFSRVELSQEQVKIKTVLAGKIRRYLNWKSVLQNLADLLFKIPLGFLQSFFYIFFFAPDLIFSKGGYGSVPTVFCGWLFQIPIIIHESDVTPGAANRLLSKLAPRVMVSFPASKTEYFPEKKMISVGNPIRKRITEGSKEKAKSLFNLTGEKPVILVIGGSQGSQTINDLILLVLPTMLNKFEIIHQTGRKNFKNLKAEAKVVVAKEREKYYHPLPFLREVELREAYAAADLIISRSGSGSVFEVAACGKPSILVPLSNSAQNHQVKNAYAYAHYEACVVMEETNLTPHFLFEKIKYLFAHPDEMEKMSGKAQEFSKPESAQAIAKYLITFASQ